MNEQTVKLPINDKSRAKFSLFATEVKKLTPDPRTKKRTNDDTAPIKNKTTSAFCFGGISRFFSFVVGSFNFILITPIKGLMDLSQVMRRQKELKCAQLQSSNSQRLA